jgi:antitoxin MazE
VSKLKIARDRSIRTQQRYSKGEMKSSFVLTELVYFWCILGLYIWRFTILAKVQRWGNSQGLRLSKQLLEQANIAVGEDVEIVAKEGQIILKKTRKFDLAEIVSRMPKDYQVQEEYFGKPVGSEIF